MFVHQFHGLGAKFEILATHLPSNFSRLVHCRCLLLLRELLPQCLSDWGHFIELHNSVFEISDIYRVWNLALPICERRLQCFCRVDWPRWPRGRHWTLLVYQEIMRKALLRWTFILSSLGLSYFTRPCRITIRLAHAHWPLILGIDFNKIKFLLL